MKELIGAYKTKVIFPINGNIAFQEMKEENLLKQFETEVVGFYLFSSTLLIRTEYE